MSLRVRNTPLSCANLSTHQDSPDGKRYNTSWVKEDHLLVYDHHQLLTLRIYNTVYTARSKVQGSKYFVWRIILLCVQCEIEQDMGVAKE